MPSFPVEMRDDGVWVGVAEETPHERTVTDVMAETMVAWGVEARLRDGRALQPRPGRRVAAPGGARGADLHRHPPEGAAAFAASAYGKLTGRPAACLTIAGPGATNLLTGLWDAKVDRSPVLA